MSDRTSSATHPLPLDKDEVQRRLSACYRLILDCARRARQDEATDGETLAGDPSAARVIPAVEPDAIGV